MKSKDPYLMDLYPPKPDNSNQRKALDFILSDLREKFPDYPDAFLENNYKLATFGGDFYGKYYEPDDTIFINKPYLHNKICSGRISEVKNTIVHEEAHRQASIKGEVNPFIDHWEGWLKEYLSMGGRPDEVYIKTKMEEGHLTYSKVKDSQIKDIIILTDNGSAEARDLINKRSSADYRRKPFLLVDMYGNITTKNFSVISRISSWIEFRRNFYEQVNSYQL